MAESVTTNLTTIANGAAVELFEEVLEKVLDNILDVNTEPDAVREIGLKFKVKPTPERDMGAVIVSVTAKLAPIRAAAGSVFIGKRGGHSVACDINPAQQRMDWDAESRPISIAKPKDGEV